MVREGPGAQVGATWVPKSRPRGARTAKMSSNSAARGIRAVKVRPIGWHCLSEFWNSLQTSRTQVKAGVEVYLNDQSYD